MSAQLVDQPTHFAHTYVKVVIPTLKKCKDAEVNQEISRILMTAFEKAEDPFATAYFNTSKSPVDFDFKQTMNKPHKEQVFNLRPVFKNNRADSVTIHFVDIAASTLNIVKTTLLSLGAENAS